MKERPMLFNGDMVRAILSGAKTQTRRPVKPEWIPQIEDFLDTKENRRFQLNPFGYPGDRLWIRESWAKIYDEEPFEEGSKFHFEYRADSSAKYPGNWPDDFGIDSECPKWRPSIHMPRAASRIALEVLDVHVERLQGISEKDCCADGGYSNITRDLKKPKFQALWTSVYGESSWSSNPWVWAVSFKRISP